LEKKTVGSSLCTGEHRTESRGGCARLGPPGRKKGEKAPADGANMEKAYH